MTGARPLRARYVAGAIVLAVTALAVRDSQAHIDLTRPIPREQGLSRAPNANLKEGPCGQRSNQRTDKLNVFTPGETIEVTWAETTNHRSYYRVAFDRDGDDDFPVFAGGAVSQTGDDPTRVCPVDGQVILAYELNDGAGGVHTLNVKLPDVECDNCTLQVLQYMYDRQRPYYFQCADLVLRRTPESAIALDAGALDTGRDASPEGGSLATPVNAAQACWSRLAPLDAGANARNGSDVSVGSAGPSGMGGGSANATPAGVSNSRDDTGVRASGGGCGLAAAAARSRDWSALVALCSLGLLRSASATRRRR